MINQAKEYFRSWLFPELETSLRDINHKIQELSNKIETLELRLERQENELKAILAKFDTKADSRLYYELNERLEIVADELDELKSQIRILKGKLKFVEFSLSEDSNSVNMSFDELASIVEYYIKKGFTRPSELRKVVGVEWEKLYAILTYLKLIKRVERIQDGNKRVKWVWIGPKD